ncbi:MAG: hypothetical protein CMH18_11605 [Methylophaga sp.]|uniref:hypothetical protein n=1 Tax=Methylophaga sp. TaxID=2024840 RepID=UPI000C94115A|nr:hypothetical protein [Methylophaga sp.]MAL50396.1 hypothetical protein [Methylophaga sp.]|tara:strand:+ start:744 stop:1061 length:318 start_codon:yes stop_codon:yes gene_type:complete
MKELYRTPSRIKTRYIAIFSLITSFTSFGTAILVFLYFKSPAFEDLVLQQVSKNIDWVVQMELEKQLENLRPKSNINVDESYKYFWDLVEKHNNDLIEKQIRRFD